MFSSMESQFQDRDLVDVRALDLRVILGQANVSCISILIGIPNLTGGQDAS